jgi:hypothetical protein
MSNIIIPLTTVDFSASIAEISPYLVNQLVNLTTSDRSKVDFILAEASDLPATSEALSSLNVTILNMVYMEVQGGSEYYQGSQINSCIILPLEETGSTIGAYSAPIGAPRLSDQTNGYNKEDCTLVESYSLDQPVFTGCELVDAELVYSFQVPEGTLYKAIIIFLNENTIPE